jgi:hypothetical protein
VTQPAMSAVGSVSENESYVGGRLQFLREVDAKMSGIVAGRLVGLLFLRAFLFAFLAGIVVAVIQLSSDGSSYGYGYGYGDDDGGTALIVVPAIVFIVSLLIPYREGLSEWELMLDGKGAAAESAYAAVYGTLRAREVPVTVATRRFRTSGDSTVNNFLVVGDKHTYVYVSVFAYGTSLYLGWTMWRRRRPFALLFRWLADGLGGLFGRDREFSGQLASNRTRALREAVHSALREGVDAVNYGLDIPVAATFGHEVTVETVGARPSAAPAMPPAPPSMPPAPPAAPVAPAPFFGGPQ